MPTNPLIFPDSQDNQSAEAKGQRKYPRYAVPWKIVVVYQRMGKREMYKGNISDLSLGGGSFLTDINICSAEPVIATIEIPAHLHDQKNTIVGVKCLVLLSILSSNYGKYRIGVKFVDFDGKGKIKLAEALSKFKAIGEN